MQPQQPALSIVAQNAELQRFYEGWNNGVFITDYTMQDSGNGFSRPVGGSRENVTNFVGSFFFRSVTDPEPVQSAILRQIEAHKLNYERTVNDPTTLSADEMRLAHHNQKLINDIIAIAEHRFSDATKKPLKQGDLLADKVLIHLFKHLQGMTREQGDAITSSLYNGKDPADPALKHFFSVMPLAARFAQSRDRVDWKALNFGYWISLKEQNDNINSVFANFSRLTNDELRALGNRITTRQLFCFMVNNPQAWLEPLLKQNPELRRVFYIDFGPAFPRVVSPEKLKELMDANILYIPNFTAEQWIRFNSSKFTFKAFNHSPNQVTFMDDLFSRQDFIESPLFKKAIVDYEDVYYHAVRKFADSNYPHRFHPNLVKAILTRLYAFSDYAWENFVRLSGLNLQMFDVLIQNSYDNEQVKKWVDIIAKVKPHLLLTFKPRKLL